MASASLAQNRPERVAVDVSDLEIDYQTRDRSVQALRGVSLEVFEGELFGLAGESGCGKSTLADTLAGLLPGTAKVRGGRALVAGHDMLRAEEQELRAIRWAEVAIVPQSAMNSLSPVLRVGAQIADAILAHESMSKRAAIDRAVDLLAEVGMDRQTANRFPHELSGGMRQRAIIAMAIALRPSVLVLDEPTTALDVVNQQSILSWIVGLQERMGFAVILVTHDLPLLVQVAHRIAVMYAGHVVEVGAADAMWRRPQHPYTQALMRAFPPLRDDVDRLSSLPGSPPDLRYRIDGCPFAPRCPYAQPYCREERPELVPNGEGLVACHLATGAIHG